MKLPTARAMPDAFVILFFIVLAAAISSYLFPAGWFAMVDIVDSAGNITQRIDPQQFFMTYDNAHHVSLFSANDKTGLTNFAFDGMTSGDRMGSAVGVMAFILIVGGAFGVVMDTGAITHCIMAMIAKLQRSQVLLIPLLFIIFSLSGAIYGMSEEAIAFCIVLLPLFQALGYSAATVVMVTYLSTQIGFATSWMNPFSVAIAQGIAGVPLMSGAGLRIAAWFVFTVVGLIFTLRYAKKHRSAVDATLVQAKDKPLNNKCSYFDILVLLCLLGVIMWVIWGVVSQGYYIPQIASQFFALALVVGLIAVIWRKRSLNQISSAFQKGASELLPAAMIVGFAKGVVLLLGGDDPQQPSILNTALHYAGESLATLPDVTSAIVMYIFQSIMNFFVASGSGQAALTMPIMAPLSDIAGVTRQVSVLCFQFGDGLTNLVIPTSASLMGCLGVAKISYAQWLALIWRFQLLLTLMASAVILFAVITGYS